MSAGWQVGIDIGGTFTDVVALNPADGRSAVAKVRSHPDDPVAGLIAALGAVGLDWAEVDDLVHGTTLITNAIVEGRLARVALVTTAGFADVLAIARQNRRHLYRLDLPPKLPPQVPRALTFEVGGRIDHRGAELEPLSAEDLDRLARAVAESGAEAVAVSLLHAYANPAHERAVAARIQGIAPFVALSHRINPENREYERTATTALSAGVTPLAARYIERLEALRPQGSRLHLFHSAGGMASPAALAETPLGLALSGPAAGVAAAARIAGALAIDHAIAFDMGGTTTDVCLIVAGAAEVRADRSLAGRPLRQPMVAVESIGAGGGSIARIDTGMLRVGPESAGADPGPAAYGRGGERATVSDANLVLGYLQDGQTVGGTIRLSRAAAEAAVGTVAAAAGTTVERAALGIVRVANAAMARALNRVTVERGIDGRRCTLIAFGGAGPMHAVALARSFGIGRIVVPHASSAFSALGCLAAEMRYTQQRTLTMASAAWDAERLAGVRRELAERLLAPLAAAGLAGEIAEVAHVRYSGQSYAVAIAEPDFADPAALDAAFKARHAELYGFATDEPWELVSVRVTARAPRPIALAMTVGGGGGEPHAVAPAWFDETEPVATPRYGREGLGAGRSLAGPAIVEDAFSTIVIPPGATLTADADGHLHLEAGAP